MTISFSDPLFSSQWSLVNTGQRGGLSRLDLNLLPAWQLGYTGAGIRVAINDDGMDLTHPDLLPNLELASVYDTNRDTTGEGFVGTGNSHGTVVGSIVGMAANGLGGVGIAYQAKLIPALAVGATVPNASAKLFAANIRANVDVSVNSWGSDPAFDENFGASGTAENQAWGTELLRAATAGRNGLGMVLEVSAGNERANRADSALSNFTGNKVTISVAAVDELGAVTSYSTPGASNLVAAFGGVSSADQSQNTGFGVVAADVQAAAGYNTTAGADGDYSYQNQGTSYSGPMVGATAALMLQANPGLGFRDVASILAMTARQTDASNASWVTNGATAWNVGGMHFSRDYGYGVIDIAAAVRLAQSWSAPAATVANWVKAESGPRTQAVLPIPDDAAQSLTVTARVADNVRIDRMEFDLNLRADSPSQLKAEITSPAGTTVTLFDRPLTRPLKDGAPDPAATETTWPATFTIGSTAFMGEGSAGTWTLKLTDLVSGVSASFNDLTVRAWGSALTVDDQHILTDEYRGARTLTDAGGTDTLNAAAVSKPLVLDLSGWVSSRVGAEALSLDTGTVIEHVVGGAGADQLTGNAVANRLRGNEGNDTIDGGAGIDTAVYGAARNTATVSVADGLATVRMSGAEGTDTLRNVERIQFSDSKLALDLLPTAAAGQTVLALGVLFPAGLRNAGIVGAVLGLADAGLDATGITQALAANGILAQLAGSTQPADIARMALRNVLKAEPAPALVTELAGYMDGRLAALTPAQFAGTVANLEVTQLAVGLVGLQQTGLAFA